MTTKTTSTDAAGQEPADSNSPIVLKPCPFCGGNGSQATVRYTEETVREQDWKQSKFHYVSCVVCAANNRGLVGHDTPEIAAAKWNARHLCSLELAVVVGRGLENMGSNPSPAKVRDLLIELQAWAMNE